MPAARITMRKLKELLRLKLDCGLGHRQIERALGVSVGVVSKYCTLAAQAKLTWPAVSALDEAQIEVLLIPQSPPRTAACRIAPDYEQVHRELKRKGVTLMLLWQEYREAHAGEPTYQYTQFTRHYHEFARRLKRSMRQVHHAGEKLFVDYAGQTVPVWDSQSGGVAFQAQIFVAVSGASSYIFACATQRQTMGEWLRSISLAFEFLDGVPALVVPDNARALIGQADRYEPQAQASVLDFARHYGCALHSPVAIGCARGTMFCSLAPPGWVRRGWLVRWHKRLAVRGSWPTMCAYRVCSRSCASRMATARIPVTRSAPVALACDRSF